MAKRAFVKPIVRCDECGGDSVHGHADWCMAATEEEEMLSEHDFFDEDDDEFDTYEDDDEGDDERPLGERHS